MSESITISLGEVVDILTGNPFKSAEYEDGEANPKLLRGDNIAQGSLRWENVKRWPKTKSKGLDRYKLKKGDVVLAMDRPWIEAGLKYACLSEHDLPAFLVQRVARMRGTERLRTDFLRYLIGSKAFTDYVLGVQTGTAVPHISANQIKSFEFDLPTLENQESIAKYLGSLDGKIELNRQMNETLEEVARALFRDWFVDFGPTRRQMEGATDPVAIMGNAFPPEKAAELASLFPAKLGDDGLPEGWETGLLSDRYNISIGRTPPRKEKWHFREDDQGIPWLSIRDLGSCGLFVFETAETLEETSVASSRVPLVDADTVLVSFKLTVGRVAIAARPMATNEAIAHLKTTEKSAPKEFTYSWMKQFDYGSLGSTSSIATAVNSKTIRSMPILCPGQKPEKSYATVAGPLLAKVKANQQENQTLAEMRELLLPKLMSGEIRLKDREEKNVNF